MGTSPRVFTQGDYVRVTWRGNSRRGKVFGEDRPGFYIVEYKTKGGHQRGVFSAEELYPYDAWLKEKRGFKSVVKGVKKDGSY